MKTGTRVPKTAAWNKAICMIPIEGMTKEEWLEERRFSIGGSEIGGILGMNPYASAYSIYCERKGLFPAFEGNLATDVGTCLEEFVAKKFAAISGYIVNRTNFIYRNECYPHLHASPDRVIRKKKARKDECPFSAGLECKTTSEFNAGKVHGVDFPQIYYSQCVQYMMVCDVPVWYLAVLVGNREFHIFMLTRDPSVEKPDWCEGRVVVPEEDCRALWKAANDFWQLLENNTPPEPDGSDASAKAIKKVFADVKEGTADLWGQEDLLHQYMAIDKVEKDAKS